VLLDHSRAGQSHDTTRNGSGDGEDEDRDVMQQRTRGSSSSGRRHLQQLPLQLPLRVLLLSVLCLLLASQRPPWLFAAAAKGSVARGHGHSHAAAAAAAAAGAGAADPSVLANTNPRFAGRSSEKDFPAKKPDQLIFISITSSGHHAHLRHGARSTWLLPCKLSAVCDYRFFVDRPKEYIDKELELEEFFHKDMVFRDACPLMSRHPIVVNYGNSPPIAENFVATVNVSSSTEAGADGLVQQQNVSVPNYKLRRAYKIDWKVCFMKWALANDRMAHLHAFVEDDSFTCVENLLYQSAMVRDRSKKDTLPFRTGTAMFDGFDDSSTFMSREVAMAFAQHYGEEGFNCSAVLDETEMDSNPWISWGNSWIHKNCNWQQALNETLGLPIREPNIKCMLVGVDVNDTAYFPCSDRPIFFHHRDAGEILLRDEQQSKLRLNHVCEYMLTIDKVKSVDTMYALWNGALGHSYHDFSAVFLQDGFDGWKDVMRGFREEEDTCRRWWNRNRGKEEAPRGEAEWSEAGECLYQHGRRRRRRLLAMQHIYSDNSSNNVPSRTSTSTISRGRSSSNSGSIDSTAVDAAAASWWDATGASETESMSSLTDAASLYRLFFG
jgi:hypothetical protein